MIDTQPSPSEPELVDSVVRALEAGQRVVLDRVVLLRFDLRQLASRTLTGALLRAAGFRVVERGYFGNLADPVSVDNARAGTERELSILTAAALRAQGFGFHSRTAACAFAICNVVIFVVALFLPAGTPDWWRAWAFLGVVFVCSTAGTVSVYRTNKAVLEERFKLPLQKGQPHSDKVVVILLIASFLGLIVFIPLDVFRFHLMAGPGPLVSSLGLVLFAAGWLIMTLALRENAFASPAGKLQKEGTTR